jgi:SAM-dependent methyltransferase
VITATTDIARFIELCSCARCFSALADHGADELVCTECGTVYPIVNGVLHLLPEYDDEVRARFLDNYNEIAKADLDSPFEENRAARHATLLRFIGDVRGKRVLDVGSSNAGYLQRMEGAAERVALDLAAPFLEAIPTETGILRVCADAETLPFRPGSFDVIVIADVLEHLLAPEHLVQRILAIVEPRTRVIVHIPWEEDLAQYRESEWEFAHLRSFTYYTFATLWNTFRIVRERSSYPALEEPFVFQLRRFLPLRLYNLASWAYFHRGYGTKEYERRARWIHELPERERWLVRLYRPLFKMFELRVLDRREPPGSGYAAPVPRVLLRLARALKLT